MKFVSTEKAPKAIGPYSQAVKAGNGLVFCSGSIPLNPQTMEIVSGGIVEQTTRAIENVKAVLEAANSKLELVVKTTVFLKNMNDFTAMNEVYGKVFMNSYMIIVCWNIIIISCYCSISRINQRVLP